MFDDQPIGNGGQTPNNLPVGEPEDMFARVDNEDILTPPVLPPQLENQPVIPSSSRSALGAGVLQPKDNNQPPVSNIYTPNEQTNIYSNPAMDNESVNRIKGPTATRGIMIAVIVVLIVAILGSVGWWFYNNFVVTSDLPVEEENVDLVIPEGLDNTENTNVEEITTTTENDLTELSQDIVDEQILFGEPIDKDADGLDDNREVDIGTDPNNWDTDGDSLSDGDEVIIWKTDPMNPDSDGDSYLDGNEVKSGYNPAGPGKIFEIPNE